MTGRGDEETLNQMELEWEDQTINDVAIEVAQGSYSIDVGLDHLESLFKRRLTNDEVIHFQCEVEDTTVFLEETFGVSW